MNKTPYIKYLKSSKWKALRKEVLYKRGRICERCKEDLKGKITDIHHKTYENIFNESPEDLEILCRACHEKEHGKFKKRDILYFSSKSQETHFFISKYNHPLKNIKRVYNRKKDELTKDEKRKLNFKKKKYKNIDIDREPTITELKKRGIKINFDSVSTKELFSMFLGLRH